MFKNKINNNKKGFTLIELMIVISIVALLSSIVLASIKTARDRAVATKFRSEVNQFVNALELYRNANGRYPFEGGYNGVDDFSYASISNSNVESLYNEGALLSILMSPYLKSLPKVPVNPFNRVSIAWLYFVNAPGGMKYKCNLNDNLPKYVILFSSQNPIIFNFFPELPIAWFTRNNITWRENDTFKCFSLK